MLPLLRTTMLLLESEKTSFFHGGLLRLVSFGKGEKKIKLPASSRFFSQKLNVFS